MLILKKPYLYCFALVLAVTAFPAAPSFAQDSEEAAPALPGEDNNGLIMLEMETDEQGQLVTPEEIKTKPVEMNEDSPAPMQADAETDTGAPDIASTMPSVDELMSAQKAAEQQEEAVAEEKMSSTAEAEAEDVEPAPAVPAQQEASDDDDGLFFDAEALVPVVPSGQMVPGAPRKVDPVYEPASRLIVVRKNYESDTMQATLVSAERAVKLGRYESALELYNQMYEQNRRDPRVLIGRATAFQRLGKDEAAIRSYEELLALRPNNVEAQVNMLGLMSKTYPSVALRRLMALRDQNPRDVGVTAQVAVVQAELGRYDEALQYLGMAAAMEPKNANHLYNMAVVADRQGAKKEAIRYYEQALEVDTVYGGGRSVPRDSIFERLAQLR